MAVKNGRNIGMHTSAQDAEQNIIKAMTMGGATRPHLCMSLSNLGYAAFPDYRFRKPQGAALAVCKIVRSMKDRGVIGVYCDDYTSGYYLRPDYAATANDGEAKDG